MPEVELVRDAASGSVGFVFDPAAELPSPCEPPEPPFALLPPDVPPPLLEPPEGVVVAPAPPPPFGVVRGGALRLGLPPVALGIVSTYCCTPGVPGTGGDFARTPPANVRAAATQARTDHQRGRRVARFTARYCNSVSTANRLGASAAVGLDARDRRPAGARWLLVIVAGGLFGLAYADGAYGLTARSILAITLWAAIVFAVALGLASQVQVSRLALTAGGLLAAFALWTLASMAWAPSPEQAFIGFDRASLYLALYLAALGTSRRRGLSWWLDGLRLGIVATAAIALASRLFPHVFPSGGIATFIPNAAARLSFPVGYWNGLAVLVAFGLPLSFQAALSGRTALARASALAAVPVISAVVFLASSRGGVLAAVVGVVVFLAGSGRRWAGLAVVAIGVLGSAFAVLLLHLHPVLVNGPFDSGAAESQGRLAAVLIVLVAALTGALLASAEVVWADFPAPSRRVGWSLLVAAAAVCVLALVAAHPLRRFDEFRQPPVEKSTLNFVTAHLTSGSGSGRWQFWTAAVHEWESAPFDGRGSGSYQYWWAQHASFTYSLKNAHSLYLETLGELGIVGLLLLAGAFACGVAGAVRGLRRAAGVHREALAAVTGVLVAFVVAAGIDWIWQLPAVGGVGVAALALAAAPGSGAVKATSPQRRRSWLALGAVALLVGWAAICAQAIPWLTATRISDSQAAARQGNLAQALRDAQDARSIQPWAATPYLQLALVAEARGELPSALVWIRGAIDRDSADWANWYIAARIAREAGYPAAAARAYAKARSLNIRSPLFASPVPPS